MASAAESSERTPVLVVCDAGAAGRDLLVRKDLELMWALTAEEASACLKQAHPELVLVREAMAAEVLSYARSLDQPPSVMVLLEPDGWANRQGYLKLGASALAQSSGRERILEGVSELTGRTFPDHIRVPFTEFVDVHCAEASHLAETVDMSSTGIGLRYLPDAEIGVAVRVQIDSLDPPLSLPAMVIRRSPEVVGLRFLELSAEVQARLNHLVDVQTARFPPPEMPEGLTVDLAGTFTMELFECGTFDLDGDRKFKTMLSHAVLEGQTTRDNWPRWLVNLESKLTPLERRDFANDPLTHPASAAVDLRIMLARTRTEEPYTFPTPQIVQQVLDFSRLLEDFEGAPEADLADIASLRGQLLRAVYGDLSKKGSKGPKAHAA